MTHGTHNVTLTHSNMVHGTHNVTLTHCNMMHGTHNVKNNENVSYTLITFNTLVSRKALHVKSSEYVK